MGGDSDIGDIGRKIDVDASGNVYVVGEFRASADFGSTTLSTAGDSDGFVAKLNAGGTIQWAKDWGTTVNDMGAGVGVDTAGNVYALSIRNLTGYDLSKFSSSGTLLSSQSISTGNISVNGDLAVDGSGDVFVAGTFQGNVDFDPSNKTNYVSSGASHAAFVLKLNANGKFGWVTPFVGQTVGATNGYSAGQSLTLDGGGNVIVGGYYDNAVDFNPGSGTTTLPTIGGGFITKLNSAGALVWARALESNDSTFVYSLDTDSTGSIYATGNLRGTVDFDPGAGTNLRTTAGDSDIYVVKLTAAGNYSWAETFGGSGYDIGWGVAVDPTGGIHLVGGFTGTVDFDPDPFATYYLTAPGTYGTAFRLRLRQV